MFRSPTCKSNNCLSPHIKPSSNKKLKVYLNKDLNFFIFVFLSSQLYCCLSISSTQPHSMIDSKCVTILKLDNFTINQSFDQ